MAIDTTPSPASDPEAIQFLADLAENNERAWFTAAQGRVRATAQGAARGAVRRARRSVPGTRDPARGRPDPLAVPDLPRCPVLEGQVAVQDQCRCLVPVGGRRRRGRPARVRRERQPGRLLPHVAGRGVHRRRDVAPADGQARGLPQRGRRRPEARPRPPRRSRSSRRRSGRSRGDTLTRVPPGFPKDHPEAELLKQKDLTFGRRLADDDVFSPGLPDLIADSFAAAVPVMRWLAAL